MEQLKAYALRKHFFRVLNEDGVETAYEFLLHHPPMIDKLSKAYQDSKDETYLLQLNRLTEQELLQSQNEISMLLVYAPWNLNLWNLFAKTFSEKKLTLKQEILWFIANKRNNRYSYLQFVNAVRGERQWNLEAMYAQLKLIEVSKFKQVHIQQLEFLTQKTFFELDYLTQHDEKIRKLTTLYNCVIKKTDHQDLFKATPYFCLFCSFHLGEINKTLTQLVQVFNEEEQLLMVNLLLYYDYVDEARILLASCRENDLSISQSLLAYFETQIQAFESGELMIKPLMLLLKRYPKQVGISLIEEVALNLESHSNQPLIRACLKYLCELFNEDQAIGKLYMKSLVHLDDPNQGFWERVAILKLAKTLKQRQQYAKELLVYSYGHECVQEWEHLVHTDERIAAIPLADIHQSLTSLDEGQRKSLVPLLSVYHQKDYTSLFEQLSQMPHAHPVVELIYLLNPSVFIVAFTPWLLTNKDALWLTSCLSTQHPIFEKLTSSDIHSNDVVTLQEDPFLQEKIQLYFQQAITLETLCVFIELKSYLWSKEAIVKQILGQLSTQHTQPRFASRYSLLMYLSNWCATDKLMLNLARCCYRLKKYEEATLYFKKCAKQDRQREDVAMELYISEVLSFNQHIERPNSKVLRQTILLFMGDRHFIKNRTDIYLYYLKQECQEELLMWWYHLYRRLGQYDLALGVIDQFMTQNIEIYQDVLTHFYNKLEQHHQLDKNRVLDSVKQRLKLLEETTCLKQVFQLQPFDPHDIKTLNALMFEHDVNRNLLQDDASVFEVEWVDASREANSWFKKLIKKASFVFSFSKS